MESTLVRTLHAAAALENDEAAVVHAAHGLETRNLSASYGDSPAIKDITLGIQANKVTALIGPSGCGKSTFVRCLNRLHEVTRGARVSGEVLLEGQDLYARDVDSVAVRRAIGMVFQRPNPFPTMSIFDNVVAGLRLSDVRNQAALTEVAERCLRQAALWDEVKDKLKRPALELSGGQQQRLCIARVLAVDPSVILMDEPCSALDPISTLRIEDLIRDLRRSVTIVIVTHNMQQAARVSDDTAFLLAEDGRGGSLVEMGPTRTIFTNPSDSRTENYITGRFG